MGLTRMGSPVCAAALLLRRAGSEPVLTVTAGGKSVTHTASELLRIGRGVRDDPEGHRLRARHDLSGDPAGGASL